MSVLATMRELFGQHPGAMKSSPETLTRMLYVLWFLPYRPGLYEVEEALETLQFEDG